MELLEGDRVKSILDAFYRVYNYFDYGLIESAYAGALAFALADAGHEVARELSVDVRFEGRHVCWQRLDMVVDRKVIVEIKATEKLPEHAPRQLLTYLRATPIKVGLLLHFGPRPAFRRYVDTRKRQFEILMLPFS